MRVGSDTCCTSSSGWGIKNPRILGLRETISLVFVIFNFIFVISWPLPDDIKLISKRYIGMLCNDKCGIISIFNVTFAACLEVHGLNQITLAGDQSLNNTLIHLLIYTDSPGSKSCETASIFLEQGCRDNPRRTQLTASELILMADLCFITRTKVS